MKKIKKDITNFTGASIGLGIGTAVVSGVGGSTAGLGAVSSMMSPIGSVMMGGHTLRLTKKLYKKKK